MDTMTVQDPQGDHRHEPTDSAESDDAPGGLQRSARKVAVGVVGGAVTATGIVLLPLPGPGTPIVLGGLAILATEYPAARRQLDRLKKAAKGLFGKPQ